jgi:hypothetical protein
LATGHWIENPPEFSPPGESTEKLTASRTWP